MASRSKWRGCLLGLLFSALFFNGAKTHATTISDFEKLSDADAERYLLYLAQGAIKYLRAHGDPAMAKKARDYFTDGNDVGVGYVDFTMDLQLIEITNLQNAPDPTKPQYPVESAFALALQHGGITGIPLSAIPTFGAGFKVSPPSPPPKAPASASKPSTG